VSNLGNLTPWKPGQPGNPNGGSRKTRTRILLRELFAQKLGETLPPAVQEKLANLSDGDRAYAEKQLAALTYGDLIATRILLTAAIGSNSDSAKAIDQILGGEPKQLGIELQESAEIQIDVSPERIVEIVSILKEAGALG
jgi:hypothetical protein